MGAVDHISLGVNDLAAARRFYDAALAPLGFQSHPGENDVGYFSDDDPDDHAAFAFYIGFADATAKRPVLPGAGFHIAFRAPTREAVVRFHEAALRAGGRDDGPRGLRARYHADYFAAFVLDPDGHRIEAVCHVTAVASGRSRSPLLGNGGSAHSGAGGAAGAAGNGGAPTGHGGTAGAGAGGATAGSGGGGAAGGEAGAATDATASSGDDAGSSGGCDVGGRSTGDGVLFFALLGLPLLRRRRSRQG